MRKYLFILGFVIAFAFSARAQAPVNPTMPVKSKSDSLQEKRDSVKSKPFVPKISSIPKAYHPDSLHSPTKAWHRSAFIPGWGQVYNRKYWKVPIIYTGFTLLVLMYRFNADAYNEYLTIARYYQQGTEPKPGDKYYDVYQYLKTGNNQQAVTDATRSYARYRDLAVIIFVAGWGIQTIDAYVDAKFKHSYSMDNDFSVKLRPTLINPPLNTQTLAGAIIPGLKVTFTLP
ncbi:MAG TPA: DUF5683 domain-containing protein [Mucilaginibacter sp.]|jgi:hypothetical protein|nr:DUF5683 domain-containing protein [Mucilaginibacter sp.]